MRITNITPKIFGRYRSDAPLDLPDSSMVVIYGNNEVGKTTYADMAVTLLSNDYDTSVIGRYGNRADPIRGEIAVSESGSTNQISFSPTARIPARATAVARKSSPETPLWTRIQNIQGSILRNIFRVSSHEITDGKSSKMKFDDYGLGDRRGAPIRAILTGYESDAEAENKKIAAIKKVIRDLDTDLRKARKSTENYEKLLSELSKLDRQIEEKKSQEIQERALQSQLSFCEGAQTTTEAGDIAEFDLRELETSGQLINSHFSDVDTRITQITNEISDLQIPSNRENLDTLLGQLRKQTEDVNLRLTNLLLTRDSFVSNVALTSNEARKSVLKDLVDSAAKRAALTSQTRRPEVVIRQTELQSAEDDLATASSEWEKFNANLSAHEYVFSPPPATRPTPQVTGSPFPVWVYGIPAVGIIISIVLEENSGVGISLAFAAILGFLQFSASRSVTEPIREPESQHDRSDAQTAAQRVIAAGTAKNDADSRLSSLTREEGQRDKELKELSEKIQLILDQSGLPFPVLSDAATFSALFEDLKAVADSIAAESALTEQIAGATEKLDRLQEQFSEIIVEVEGILTSLKIEFNKSFFASTNAACEVLQTLRSSFQTQNTLREAVKSVDRLFIGRNDESEIRPLMTLTPDERRNRKVDSEDQLKDMQDEREEFESQHREKSDQLQELEDISQLTNLRSELDSLNEQLLELQFNRLRLVLQARVLRKFATQRAQDSKPELVKKVQEMVLSVAHDWKSVEFLTNSDGKIESIEVKKSDESIVLDSQLSSGAQSLLYLAMRIAIMQQEAINGLSIPMFCDDPLIFMDDTRTRSALQMLSNASEGHQIIYFTCKQEIRDLALKMEIPVITI